MRRISTPLLVVLLAISMVGMATAVPLCPFDPIDSGNITESVPAGTTVHALTVGSVHGYSMIDQYNTWQTFDESDNSSQYCTQSNQYTSLSGSGNLDVAIDTKLNTQFYGFTSSTAGVEYSGKGMALSDTNYFGRITTGNESACEDVLTGASAMFSQGSYGSQTLGVISPEYGMTVSQEIGTGSAAPVTPQGMVGQLTISSASSQRYGTGTNLTMAESSHLSATFGGVSMVAHQFKFDSMQE